MPLSLSSRAVAKKVCLQSIWLHYSLILRRDKNSCFSLAGDGGAVVEIPAPGEIDAFGEADAGGLGDGKSLLIEVVLPVGRAVL